MAFLVVNILCSLIDIKYVVYYKLFYVNIISIIFNLNVHKMDRQKLRIYNIFVCNLWPCKDFFSDVIKQGKCQNTKSS